MRAEPGDWLIVNGRNTGAPNRRGRIEEVRSADGAPPYLVRWSDTDTVALTFPGPDSYVVSFEELKSDAAAAGARYSSIQDEIAGRRSHR
jgi:hypothetical protein